MPPDCFYMSEREYFGESGYNLHRWIIGNDNVDMSTMPSESDDTNKLFAWKKSGRFPPPFLNFQIFLKL